MRKISIWFKSYKRVWSVVSSEKGSQNVSKVPTGANFGRATTERVGGRKQIAQSTRHFFPSEKEKANVSKMPVPTKYTLVTVRIASGPRGRSHYPGPSFIQSQFKTSSMVQRS
jgi:hypothetical protein